MASPAVERMKEALFTGLDYMAMPGDYLRGALADSGAVLPGGRPVRRTTGRELLEAYGLVSPNQEGFDAGDAAGFATDLLVDPLNVLLGAGAIKGGLKGVRALTGAAKAGKAAESLTAAKEALGAIPGAAMRQSPAIAYSIGAPVGGAYLMANNEEGSDWKDLVGMGLMASPFALPLAMAAGKPLRKWSKKSVAEAVAAEDAKAALQAAPAPSETLPISRPEIDFLEQLGIRDATKWQEIKRMLGGTDARTPEAQAVIQRFLPR